MYVIAIAFGLLGAVLASFAGVIAERMHTGQSWAKGRSRCNSCREQLQAKDLFPIASWLSTGGRCRYCSAKIPAQYVLFELCLAVVFAAAVLKLGLTLSLGVFLAAVLVVGVIVLYDLRHMLVPLTAAGVLIALAILAALIREQNTGAFMVDIAIAACVALFFLLLHVGSRGRAMGLGDTPVAFGLALLVGWVDAITGLLFSFWIGAIIGIAILVMRRGGPTMGIAVPFVPFMAAGFLLAYLTSWTPLPL